MKKKPKELLTDKQRKILVNHLQVIGLMSLDESLPKPARALMDTTYREVVRVYQQLNFAVDIPKDGYVADPDAHDEQWPLDNSQRWQALK